MTVTANGIVRGDVTYRQNNDGTITVTLTGATVDHLRRAASVLNACTWSENDNTPISLLSLFDVGAALENWGEEGPHNRDEGLGAVLDDIAYAIETGAHGDEDTARRQELRRAFDTEFGITNG